MSGRSDSEMFSRMGINGYLNQGLYKTKRKTAPN
ncbi:Uncharacterised protein [Yersinia frederiksenii]|jgi:hypothetical protein|uniref:Uncharacterized protein n=1 Tax=Yersinia frederiksenii TaxID=29484 RepID=A0AAI8ZSJ0_YERFR|nr:Uncharacterised protein [Yersinia frederiksenii]CFR25683.1 Uncharacterised protein [Yersinia frederiksenii]CNG92232.1 Uncharacterised protein [Yersinia frederiksenii]CQH36477.1 Uncharacterised protein [Yersinia frederiksenii]CQI97453.1 Uncharacterised protein [Yersinia frederiksenii]